MKTFLVLALAAFTFTAAPSITQASDCYRTVSYCKPYVVCTEILSKCRSRRMGYDSCGNCYYYFVTVVTYRDVYSDGSTQRYTRSFRS